MNWIDEETERALKQSLEPNRIRSREAGFGAVEYLPAHDVIRRANEIFGFGGWSGHIIDLQQELREQRDGKWTVVYRCVYEVKVGERTQQDVGVGVSTRETLADAVENAIKFAASDGIKRSLRAWGDQFGLSLYAEDTGTGSPDEGSMDRLTLDSIRALIGESRRKWPAKKARASLTDKQTSKIKDFWNNEVERPTKDLGVFLSEVTRRSIDQVEQLTRAEASGILDFVFHHPEELKELLEEAVFRKSNGKTGE